MYRIEYNGTIIHDPSKFSSDCILMECTYSGEIGKVDTLDFTILPFHPFYNEFTRLQTGIVAYRDDHEIFRGRILSSSVDLYGNKKVQCEGSLAYLLDTIQPKMVYAEEDETAVSGAQLFRTIIANHNSQVEEVKRFTVGEITALKANDIIEVNQTSYTETRSMIDQYLLNTKGGYLRVRYENGVQYIDWVEDFGRNPNQTIKVGANVISFTEEISADDFYTVLFPIGTEKAVTRDTEEEIEEDDRKDHTITIASVNNDSPYLIVSQEFVNKYGYIYHNEDYGTVANPAELLRLANDTMTQFRKKLNRTVEIGGLDLHFIDSDVDQIILGDRVQIIAPNFDKNERLMLTKVDYDFQDPSKDKFSFGDGLQTLTKRTEANISHTSSTAKKAKNDSLTNGRDLFVKKNLIDIQANNMSVKVNEAMKVVADTIDFTFRKLTWESQAYTIQNDMEKAAIRAQFDNEWSQVTRSMSGYIDTQEGMAAFNAISNIVGSMGRQNNTVTAALDSDQGFFSWRSTQNTISEQGNYLQTLGVTVNGNESTVGLVAKTDQALDDLGDISRTVSDVSLTLCGDQDHPGIVSQVGQYINGNYINSVINQTADQVKISASKVDLGEYATVGLLEAQYVTAEDMHAEYGTGDELSVNDIDCDTIVCNSVNAAQYYVGVGENPDSLSDAIKTVSISGPDANNMYKLQYTTFMNDTPQDAGTFSRATNLTRGWSGGDLTVRATPQGNRFVHHLGRGVSTWDNYTLYIPIVYSENSDYDTVNPTGYTVEIDLSDEHTDWSNAGWVNAKLSINPTEKEISTTNQGNITAVSIAADVDITYDSTTHVYNITPKATANSILMDSFTIATDDDAYEAGVTYGQSIGYAGAKLNIDSTEKEISITNQGSVTSATISAVPGIIYNSATHTYTATATAKANNITMDANSIVGNDQAYQDGVIYGASTGYAAARLSIDDTNSKIDITNTGDITSATIGATAGISYNSSTHTYTATATADANGTDMATDTATGGTEAYRAGYDANNTARLSAVRSSGATSTGTLSYGETVTVTAQYMTYDGNVINTSRSLAYTAPADRYSQGQTAAGLSIDASNHTINRATSSDTKSVTITLDIGASGYDGEVYAAPITVKAGNTVLYSQYCVTEAPPENAYDSGWSLGWDQGYTRGYQDASGQTPSTHYTAVSAKRASTLTLYSQNKMSMARYIDSEDRYVSAGYHYWYYSETKGFETLYARS